MERGVKSRVVKQTNQRDSVWNFVIADESLVLASSAGKRTPFRRTWEADVCQQGATKKIGKLGSIFYADAEIWLLSAFRTTRKSRDKNSVGRFR